VLDWIIRLGILYAAALATVVMRGVAQSLMGRR
jgi:hypothetical protein